MDNRLRFLYCVMTELWGRAWRARAGSGEPGASERGAVQANPHGNTRRRDAERNESSEEREPCAKKSRYRS